MQVSTKDRVSCAFVKAIFALVEAGKWRQYLISHDKSDLYPWLGPQAMFQAGASSNTWTGYTESPYDC